MPPEVPRFLSGKAAAIVVNDVLDSVMGTGMVNRDLAWRVSLTLDQHIHCHVVVLAPQMETVNPDGTNVVFPNFLLKPHKLVEVSRGVKNEWAYPFDEIAECKAMQLWHGRNDDRTDIMPHLLFGGDTPYWGGVVRQGLVVACSGFQCHFDKMISGVIADVLIAVGYNSWMTSADKRKESNFIT